MKIRIKYYDTNMSESMAGAVNFITSSGGDYMLMPGSPRPFTVHSSSIIEVTTY
jgi:hypothetical protein